MANYTVNVGNIGNIEYTNRKEARQAFNDYIEQSKSNYGRASGESVTILLDGEIIDEYIGTIDQDENDF